MLILLLAACTGSADPPGAPGDSDGDQAVVQPTGAGVSGDTPGAEVSDELNPEPDLYRVDPVTGETEPILAATRGLHEPERSPDGSQLVYQSVTPSGTPQIFAFDHERRRQLTQLPGGAVDPTWSPDGSSIAFAARSRAGEGARIDTDIFVMDADGGHVRRLVGTTRWDRRPDWSPDGSHVVFDTFGEIWVASIHDGELTRVISHADITLRHGPAADPTWSPDGRRIAITHFAPGTLNGRIPYAHVWVMRADGTGERPLHPSKRYGVYELDPSWSPDGGSIAFSNVASRIGIVDVPTRAVTYLSTSHVAGLSWGTEGIVVSRGDGVLHDPSPWGPDPDPWFDG